MLGLFLLLATSQVSASSVSSPTKLSILVASTRIHRDFFPIARSQMLAELAIASDSLSVSAELAAAISARANAIYDMNALHKHVSDCLMGSYSDPKSCIRDINDKAELILLPAVAAHRCLLGADTNVLHQSSLVIHTAYSDMKAKFRSVRKFRVDDHFQGLLSFVTKFFFEISSIWGMLHKIELSSFYSSHKPISSMSDRELIIFAAELVKAVPPSERILSEMMPAVGTVQRKYGLSTGKFHLEKERGRDELVKSMCSLSMKEGLVNTANVKDDFFSRQLQEVLSILQPRNLYMNQAGTRVYEASSSRFKLLVELAQSRQELEQAQTALMRLIGQNPMALKYTLAQSNSINLLGSKLVNVFKRHTDLRRREYAAVISYVMSLNAALV